MLTKFDLQSIGQIIDTKLVEQDKRFDKKLKPIRKNIREIKYSLTEIRGALNPTIAKQEHHEKRIDRLDDHLGLPHVPEPLFKQASY